MLIAVQVHLYLQMAFIYFPFVLERPIIFAKILCCSELNSFSWSKKGASSWSGGQSLSLGSHQEQDAVYPHFDYLSL